MVVSQGAPTSPTAAHSFLTAYSNALLVMSFLVLNCGLNVINKWALGVHEFKFPLLLTTCHMSFNCVTLVYPMMRESLRCKHKAALQNQWKGIVAVGVCMAANVALNNTSLVYISLSLNQVIRSAMPICTCVLAIFIESKIPTVEEGSSLLVLSAGVMIAIWEGTARGSLFGTLVCILATVFNAAMSCFTGKVMSENVDALRLTFYIGPPSCCILAPLYLYFEHSRFLNYWSSHTAEAIMVIGITSIIALLYNIVHAGLIHKLSATTVTVLGNAKIIGILLMSAWLLGERSVISVKMTVGMAMTVAGFIGYSHARSSNSLQIAASNAEVDIEKRSLVPSKQ